MFDFIVSHKVLEVVCNMGKKETRFQVFSWLKLKLPASCLQLWVGVEDKKNPNN